MDNILIKLKDGSYGMTVSISNSIIRFIDRYGCVFVTPIENVNMIISGNSFYVLEGVCYLENDHVKEDYKVQDKLSMLKINH